MATIVTLDDGSFGYKLRINGSLGNDEQVELRYYSTRRSYLYRSTTKNAQPYEENDLNRVVVITAIAE